MKMNDYNRVCYRTEQREENVMLRNRNTGRIGLSFGCTYEGETVQVILPDGDLDSWQREDCMEADPGISRLPMMRV